MRFLAITFFLSELIWLLLPNGQDLRPAVMPRDNLLTRLVAGLYAIDTNANGFPSVHVVGAIGAVWAVRKTPSLRHHPAIRWAVAVLAALIGHSTLCSSSSTPCWMWPAALGWLWQSAFRCTAPAGCTISALP